MLSRSANFDGLIIARAQRVRAIRGQFKWINAGEEEVGDSGHYSLYCRATVIHTLVIPMDARDEDATPAPPSTTSSPATPTTPEVGKPYGFEDDDAAWLRFQQRSASVTSATARSSAAPNLINGLPSPTSPPPVRSRSQGTTSAPVPGSSSGYLSDASLHTSELGSGSSRHLIGSVSQEPGKTMGFIDDDELWVESQRRKASAQAQPQPSNAPQPIAVNMEDMIDQGKQILNKIIKKDRSFYSPASSPSTNDRPLERRRSRTSKNQDNRGSPNASARSSVSRLPAPDERRLADLLQKASQGIAITSEQDLSQLALILRSMAERHAEETDATLANMAAKRAPGATGGCMDMSLIPRPLDRPPRASPMTPTLGSAGSFRAAGPPPIVVSTMLGTTLPGGPAALGVGAGGRLGRRSSISFAPISPLSAGAPVVVRRRSSTPSKRSSLATIDTDAVFRRREATASDASDDADERAKAASEIEAIRGTLKAGPDAAMTSTRSSTLMRQASDIDEPYLGPSPSCSPIRGPSLHVSAEGAGSMSTAAFQGLLASTQAEERAPRRKLPRLNGAVPVFVHDEAGTCHFYTVAPCVTVNEIRAKVLKELGVTESTETLKVYLVRQVEGRTLETRVSPNMPVDFLLPDTTMLELGAATASSDFSIAEAPLTLKLRRKSTIKWNITVNLEYQGQRQQTQACRSITIDAFTTAEDLKNILMTIESVDEEERLNWAIWRDGDTTTPGSYLHPTFLFDPWSTPTLYLRPLNSRRTKREKLSAILGITCLDEVNAVMTAEARRKPSTTLNPSRVVRADPPPWCRTSAVGGSFGVPPKSKSLGSLSTICVSGKAVAGETVAVQPAGGVERAVAAEKGDVASVRSRAASRGLGRSASLSSLSTVSRGSKMKRQEEDGEEDELEALFKGHGSAKSQRSSKIASFFGVHEKDDLTQMTSMMGRKKSTDQSRRTSASHTPSFIVRIYFANKTYTGLNLPLSATSADTMVILYEKLRVHESEQDQYAIFEYFPNSGAEVEVRANGPRMYDIMSRWQNSEIFVFKKRTPTSVNRLRGSRTSSMMTSQRPSIATISDEAGSIRRSEESLNVVLGTNPKLGRKQANRLTKLVEFFGVEAPVGNGALDGPRVAQNKKGFSMKKRKDGGAMDEMLRLLNIMDKSGRAKKKDKHESRSSSKIEGWLSMKKGSMFVPSWCFVKRNYLYIHPSTSKDVAASNNTPVDVNLIDSKTDILMSGKCGFIITVKTGGKFMFMCETADDALRWVETVRAQSKGKAGQTAEADLDAEDVGEEEPEEVEPILLAEDAVRPEDGVQENALSMNDFNVHKILGRGKYGTVMLCSQKSTQKAYAVKVIEKDGAVADALLEAKILRTITHPFIVSLHATFQTPSRIYLIMGYVNGGELFFHITNWGRFSEERVRFYSAEIYLAVQALHDHGIVYRDLKLENILMDRSGHIKITDFGLARRDDVPDTDDADIVGTLEYLAPEVLEGLGTSFASDWWAFGIVTYELLSASHPFHAEDRQEIVENILMKRPSFPDFFAAETKVLLSALIKKDPGARLGGRDIRAQAFFATIDFEKLESQEMTPPFLPEVADDFDVRFFDEVFTEEPVDAIGNEEEFETVGDL